MTSASSSYAAATSSMNRLSDLSPEYIDARFERAVDIVQSLPRSGPIQTSYDDKLNLYSVYKQATEGDIRGNRPGVFDVLGRAKWDAWNRRKGLSEDEAKHAYVEHLIRILRGYADRPQAVQLLRELENFSLDAPQDDPVPPVLSEEDERARRRRERAPPPPSLSVAPSLPGYGPPRTTTDPIRQSTGSSDSDDDDSSSAYTEEAPPPVPASTSSRPAYPPQLSHQQFSSPLPFPAPPASIHSFRSPLSPGGPRSGVAVATMQQYPSFQSAARPASLAPAATISSAQAQAPMQATSTKAVADMAAALDKIQTSLTALHERLALLETTGSMSSSVHLGTTSAAHGDSATALIKDLFVRLLVRFNVIHPSSAVSSSNTGSRTSLWIRFVRLVRGAVERAIKDVVVIVAVAAIVGRWTRNDWRSLYALVLQNSRRSRSRIGQPGSDVPSA